MTEQVIDIHPVIAQIVDRDCHVSLSNRVVIRNVISKLRYGYQTFRDLPKEDRKAFMTQCIAQHKQNWELYVSVMSGSPGPKKTEAKPEEVPEKLTGEEVCRLMRKHKKTIKQLSFLLGIPCKRIREVRKCGLDESLAVRDWLEQITGEDPGPIPASYRINRHTEESACCYCGCPLYVGDTAFEYVDEAFCSRTCCRKSRGWT